MFLIDMMLKGVALVILASPFILCGLFLVVTVREIIAGRV